MAATFRVISRRVGEHGQKSGRDLLRIKQLLARVHLLDPREIPRDWDEETKEAVLSLQQHHDIPKDKRTEYLDPGDPSGVIFELLWDAGVLLPLPHPRTGAAALEEFFNTALHYKVPYAWEPLGRPDRKAYGLAENPRFLIFTNSHDGFDQDNQPRAMNCTSFTNLVLSVWQTGNAHAPPYDASQDAGGFVAVASRYGLSYLTNPCLAQPEQPAWSYEPVPLAAAPLAHGAFAPQLERVHLPSVFSPEQDLTFFYNPQEITAVVKPMKLYYLQWCYLHDTRKHGGTLPSGFGHHDTVLCNNIVYEINNTEPYLFRTPLIQRWGQHKEPMRLMGPLLE